MRHKILIAMMVMSTFLLMGCGSSNNDAGQNNQTQTEDSGTGKDQNNTQNNGSGMDNNGSTGNGTGQNGSGGSGTNGNGSGGNGANGNGSGGSGTNGNQAVENVGEGVGNAVRDMTN